MSPLAGSVRQRAGGAKPIDDDVETKPKSKSKSKFNKKKKKRSNAMPMSSREMKMALMMATLLCLNPLLRVCCRSGSSSAARACSK